MDERVLLMSGFYGVRLPDGRRLLEKPPQGQIVEGPNPGPFNLSVGNSPTFRVLNLGDGRYVLQYGPDQIPITLYYRSELEGATIPSFEGPFQSDNGISAVGMNQGAYATLFPPTTAQPETALPGYAAPPSIQDITQQAVRDRAALDALTRANAAAGRVADFTPPELQRVREREGGPTVAPSPSVAHASGGSGSASTDVYYAQPMQSTPGGAIVDTRNAPASMPSGISPIAVAGAMVLLFLLGDDKE